MAVLSANDIRVWSRLSWVVAGGLVLAGCIVAFPASFLLRSNVWIGILLFPFALYAEGKQRTNYLYAAAGLLFMALAWTYHVRMFYFFTIVFFLLFVLELIWGRINFLVLFLVALMSPFFEQVATITGFAFRLQISQWAGIILSMIGTSVSVEGNMIILDGAAFSVDEPCTGLNMLAISLLMGVFLLVVRYRERNVLLPFTWLSVYFLIGFILNVAANLIRIVVLVLFRIGPDDPMHDVAGILIMSTYVIMPLFFLAGLLVRRFGATRQTPSIANSWSVGRDVIFVVAATLIFACGLRIGEHRKKTDAIAHAEVSCAGLDRDLLRDGITRFSGETLLIYVKPIPEFFTGEHSPLLCWKGSGYTFNGAKETRIDGHAVYTGRLKKGTDQLCTAWWYSNGAVETISQIEWRLRMLQGEKRFCLVNVTADDESTLTAELERIFTEKKLRIEP